MNEKSYKNKAGDGNTSLEISFYYICLKYMILNLDSLVWYKKGHKINYMCKDFKSIKIVGFNTFYNIRTIVGFENRAKRKNATRTKT